MGISTTHSPQNPSNIDVSSVIFRLESGLSIFRFNPSWVFLGEEEETRILYWSVEIFLVVPDGEGEAKLKLLLCKE
jgi:hypothetical protein